MPPISNNHIRAIDNLPANSAFAAVAYHQTRPAHFRQGVTFRRIRLECRRVEVGRRHAPSICPKSSFSLPSLLGLLTFIKVCDDMREQLRRRGEGELSTELHGPLRRQTHT